MAKEVLRIGKLYLEEVGYHIRLLALDFPESGSGVSGVDVLIPLEHVVELVKVLQKYVSRFVEAKDCVTCVNFKVGCRLETEKKLECLNKQKIHYKPAFQTV